MISYDVPEKILDKVKILAKDLEMINTDDNEIKIFPDFNLKNKVGFPSGIKIKSKNKIYPCAIPDVGCGFRIIRINGISKEEFLNNSSLVNKIDRFLQGVEKVIDNDSIKISDMLRFGQKSTSHLFIEDRINKYEDKGYYKLDDNHTFKEVIFPLDKNADIFNSYQGHFLEFLEPQNNEKKECYLLIHTGSFILAKNFNKYYYPILSEMSYVNGWSNEEEVISGKFHIPKEASIFREYFNDVLALMNFSVSYRDLIESKIINIIKEKNKKNLDIVLLSDCFHTKLSINGNYILHQRGIQMLKKSDCLEYIISGNFGIASLLFKSTIDGAFSHGVPVDTSLYDIEIENIEHLLSPILIKDHERHLHFKKSSLAQLVYDYYLRKGIEFVHYLLPFYSFKID